MSAELEALLVPQPDRWARPYWEAAAEGRLLLQRCTACGAHQHYPRGHCTTCGVDEPAWVEASGRGTVATFTVIHRTDQAFFAERTPFAVAVVALEEGPQVLAAVEGGPGDLACGTRVAVRFAPGPGGVVRPVFAALATDATG